MGPWCGQMGAEGWLLTVAVWAVVLALVVWAVSRLFPARPAERPTPHDVLDARLAAGDLDPQTYRSLREELDGRRPVRTEGPS